MSRISLNSLNLSLNGKAILKDITWSLETGQHWGLLGANGSGKSTFLKLLRGDLWPDQKNGGSRLYQYEDTSHPDPAGIRQRFGLVSAELQERYTHNSWNPPALEVVLSGFFDACLLYQQPDPAQVRRAQDLLALLNAANLAERKFLTLSQGQARRVLLARALAPLENTPAVLMLDEASEGLDTESRNTFFESLKELFQPQSANIVGDVQLLFATHRLKELKLLSSVLTHTLLLKNGRILGQDYFPDCITTELLREVYEPALPMRYAARLPAMKQDMPQPVPENPLLEIRDAEYRNKGKTLLHVDNWRLFPGQNWAVFGANGAGKSTFLRLVYGDVPAYFSFEKPPRITRFGQKENDPESTPLLSLHRHMGFVSPELQSSLGYDMSALELACSGMHAALGAHIAVGQEEQKKARAWLDFFGIADLASQAASTLSNGQLRRVLLARALAGTDHVQGPYVLLLDEPFSGLDPHTRKLFFDALHVLPQRGVSLVCALHRRDELIPELTHGLVLESGRIAAQGLLPEVLKAYAL